MSNEALENAIIVLATHLAQVDAHLHPLKKEVLIELVGQIRPNNSPEETLASIEGTYNSLLPLGVEEVKSAFDNLVPHLDTEARATVVRKLGLLVFAEGSLTEKTRERLNLHMDWMEFEPVHKKMVFDQIEGMLGLVSNN